MRDTQEDVAEAAAPPTTTTVGVNIPDTLPDDKLIEMYVKLRDREGETKKRHTEELLPMRRVMLAIEGALMKRLLERSTTSTKGPSGTAYMSEDTSVQVRAWSETFGFIQNKELWELLEARVSKTAALAYMGETGEEIPGVVVRRENKVHVRRS